MNMLRNTLLQTILISVFLCFAVSFTFGQSSPEGLQGFWYDGDSNGFYEFRDNGTFRFENKSGSDHEGTYESAGQDDEGNKMYRAKYPDPKTGEDFNIFIKVHPGGRGGYTQIKCMKYPFYRSIES